MSATAPGFIDTIVEGWQSYNDFALLVFQLKEWKYLIQHPLFYLLLVYLATFFLELLLPKKINYGLVTRKGFWTDLLYVIFIDYAIMSLGLAAITAGVEFIVTRPLGISLPVYDLKGALSGPLGFIVFFLIVDFVQWFGHFLLHRVEWLWQFHKIHHAQETLGFASTRHFHWGEYLVLKPALWIPFGMLGYSSYEYVVYYLWIGYFLTFFSHCNINLKFGFLNYIFITPETHYWHHSRNIPRRYGVNYASSLAIWDVLFGSFYLPKDKEPVLGIPENDVPDSFMGQMIYPFKALFSRNAVPQNKDAEVKQTVSRAERRREEKKKR